MNSKYRLAVIGGSAGSMEVLLQTLPNLTGITIPIVIVLHRKNTNDSALSDLFATKTLFLVKEAEDKEKILPQTIYIAPANYHLLIEKNGTFALDASEKVNYSRPSIDVTFESAAEAYGEALLCILLSGANADGVDGLKQVKQNGGTTAVQNPDTAQVAYMPKQALEHTIVDRVIEASELAALLSN